MINSDNMAKLQLINKEILLITKNPEFEEGELASEKIYQLLDRFLHMQSLIISIRTELLVKLFSIYPYLPHEVTQSDKERLG